MDIKHTDRIDLDSSESVEESGAKSPNELPDLGNQYEVLVLLGEGGMGKVYKARDKSSDTTLAIKLPRPELASDKSLNKRFHKEVKTASELTHSNLVTVHGSARTASGAEMMIMNYIQGQTLGEFIKDNGPLEPFVAIHICIQVLEAIRYAHDLNVLHRDLKPSNIMLTRNGDGTLKAFVVDFGIARILSRPSEFITSLTHTGDIFGSPAYMSPEQCLRLLFATEPLQLTPKKLEYPLSISENQ
ncbi:MAG: serine/threonine protein kinase [Candidatus Obscuribacterales bacterium]|nr:serine/threonine protein kinase [Candidatus Obscuribacterales bacterium]